MHFGSERIDAVPDPTLAARLLDKNDYSVAILDINLGGTTSFELAEIVLGHDVPVLFVSGYGTEVELPPTLVGAPCLAKPIDRDTLAAALVALGLGTIE